MSKWIMALTAIATLSGCAVAGNGYTQKRMDIDDIRSFQVDCANAQMNIRYFESLLPAAKSREEVKVLKTQIWSHRAQCGGR